MSHKKKKKDDVKRTIVDLFAQEYPDMEVIFTEDMDEKELPPVVLASSDQLEAKIRDSLEKGICFDCGKAISQPYLPSPGEILPDGFLVYCDLDENPMMIICPDCEAKNE